MIHIECREQQCSFLTTSQDEYCPNCGVPKPQLHTSEDYLTSLVFNPGYHPWLFATAFTVLFLLAGAILVEIAASDSIRTASLTELFLAAVIIATALIWGGFALLKNAYLKSHQLDTYRSPNLKHIEYIIHQR